MYTEKWLNVFLSPARGVETREVERHSQQLSDAISRTDLSVH
jgi:hypothetical protein